MQTRINRRNLLRMAGAGVAAAAWSRPARADASGRIRCALLGAGGRGTSFLPTLTGFSDVDLVAVCDIRPAHVARAQAIMEKAGRPKPTGFGEKGPDDYKRMLESKDLDAVIIATPMQDHARMAIDALSAGKAVLSEVAAAMTLDECWGLVRAVERTGKLYMMAENVCYYRDVLAILNMVKAGLFGGLTYAECGYVHDCRFIDFNPDGSLTWRGELARDHIGNLYPTHPIGPIAQWMDINRGDRFTRISSSSTKAAGLKQYAARKFGPDHPLAQRDYALGDVNTSILQTARGRTVTLYFDMSTPRPYDLIFRLQGTEGIHMGGDKGGIYLEGKSPTPHAYEPFAPYMQKYAHPLWTALQEQAKQHGGHGGSDYVLMHDFLKAVINRTPLPQDVYDAAAWSAITPLSIDSVAQNGSAIDFPDFTQGKWQSRPPVPIHGA